MPRGPVRQRLYPVVGNEPKLPPNYARTVERMSLKELAWEVRTGKGSREFQQAVSAEIDRRRGL